MSEQVILYVGIDAHKDEHKIACKLAGPESPVHRITINNTVPDIKRLIRRLTRDLHPDQIRCCYEAGCLGFELQRRLQAAGAQCLVAAPSLIPVKPGDRIKTDARDALALVTCLESGMLTEVQPPQPQEEAARDLCRLREAAVTNRTRIRHQITKYLLRRGLVYRNGSHWTDRFMTWLASLRFNEPLDNEILGDLLSELVHCDERLHQLTQRLELLAQDPRYQTAVGWLCCFSGIQTVTAMTIITELFRFERFDHPQRLMSYLGLTPSEHSSGAKKRRGHITRQGNGHVRRLLTECAWHYIHVPHVSRELKNRRQGQEEWVVKLADQCAHRLYHRYWQLMQKGKDRRCVITVLARELTGFIWQTLYTWIAIVPNTHNQVA